MSATAQNYDVIRKPIITEKATTASENNAVVFEGKVKRFRGSLGTRKDVKKAYVTLEEGNTIDVSTGL